MRTTQQFSVTLPREMAELRGVPRDDLWPGQRTTHYRKRTVIAYQVNRCIVQLRK